MMQMLRQNRRSGNQEKSLRSISVSEVPSPDLPKGKLRTQYPKCRFYGNLLERPIGSMSALAKITGQSVLTNGIVNRSMQRG
jgi:hypothetical protein